MWVKDLPFKAIAQGFFKKAVLVVNKRNVTRKFETFNQYLQMLNLAKMLPKKKEKRHSWSYCGQILFPVASCKNESLRFSYWQQALCSSLNDLGCWAIDFMRKSTSLDKLHMSCINVIPFLKKCLNSSPLANSGLRKFFQTTYSHLNT